MSVIIRNQAVIHYEALGRGRPVVFLHSWIGSWRYWVPSMQVAANSYRAYAIDLFGYGDTTRDPHSYTLERQTDLVEGFLDEMGIIKVAVVGHGLGAWVAFSFLRRHPERVARLMCIGAPLDPAAIDPRLSMAEPAELTEWLSVPSPEFAELLADAGRADPAAIGAFLDSVGTDGLVRQFDASPAPCLLLYGRDDPSAPAPPLNHTLLREPNVHQLVLEDSGHFPMIEVPSPFNRLLVDFLALEAGASPRELQVKEEWRRRVR
jgi:pimeloyl-ACP methyl ester carboxylesterase